MTRHKQMIPLFLISIAVLLNLVGAAVLKELTQVDHHSLVIVFAGLGLVAGLNGLRFLLWGAIHKRFPLSHTYPLTALFFPMLLGMSLLYGEPVGPTQIIGTIAISVGIVILTVSKD